MQKEMQSITLLFENCDEITIPSENIKMLDCGGIKDIINKSGDYIILKKECDRMALIIIDADIRTRYGFLLFDRIFEYSDISCLYIKYKDGKEEIIELPWLDDPNCEDENQYQKQSYHKGKFIYISVRKR